jgi:hypothetical protein
MKSIENDHQFQREVCDWFRANGVDPRRLPFDPNASIADGQLTFVRKVGRPGKHGLVDVIAPGGFDVLKETVTVPLLVEPPPDVAEWVRPKCPTCGR